MTKTERPAGVETLPRRFVHYIEMLEGRLDAFEKAAAAAPNSRLRLRSSLEEHHADDTLEARFLFGKHKSMDVSLAEPFSVGRSGKDDRRSALYVHGSEGLVVQPCSSNALYVQFTKEVW